MTTDKIKEVKDVCLDELRAYVPHVSEQLEVIDPRVIQYIDHAMKYANVYELLGIRKQLRLMVTYKQNIERLHQWMRAIEGVWEDGEWKIGGLKFDTPRGAAHVQLMPYQVWCLVGMYLMDYDVQIDGKTDRRRLCKESHIFIPRKAGKTQFGAAIDVVEACVLGEANANVYIAANVSTQAAIAYKEVKKFAYQLDPAAMNRGNGRYLRVTGKGLSWKPGMLRTGEITPMTAGGNKKDGLYASLVHADEHGSASYVKDKSDMQQLVEVLASSMGPRREPMLLHTTTAGLVNEGPYQIILRQVEERLLQEMDYPLGDPKETEADREFALLLRLDPWEVTDDLSKLDNPDLFRKVNPSIGTTVQPTYYHDAITDALGKSEDSRKEVLTKLFNIWQTDKVADWIRPEQIRELQVPMSIDECTSDNGWMVFVGQDFSMGDDLHAQSYLAWRENPETGREEFFADMDGWMTSHALSDSSLKHLYQSFAQMGHLHIVDGETLEPSVPVDRIIELYEAGVLFVAFGHDPYKAKTPINTLKSWIFSQGGDPKQTVVPVRQNFATYNPLVQEMDYMIKADEPMIRFSNNALWPFEFGNCVLMESGDGMGNVKPVKRSKSDDAKVDHVQALLSALHLFDIFSSNETRE